jgi:uncharacterized RDD family membrane protein YckC
MNSDDNIIAGFWRRVGACCIDIVLLSAICGAVGFLLYVQIVSLGSYGRIIVWLIAVAYFTLLNSKLSNGQTFGKRLLEVKVVDTDGQSISVVRSFARAMILTTPFFLNGILNGLNGFPFLLQTLSLPFALVLGIDGLVEFGGIISIIYLYLFNRRTRQSLHDLLVGTFVVNASNYSPIEEVTASIHKIGVGIIGVVAAVALLVFSHLL